MVEADVAELPQLFNSVEAKQYKRPDMNGDLSASPSWRTACYVVAGLVIYIADMLSYVVGLPQVR